MTPQPKNAAPQSRQDEYSAIAARSVAGRVDDARAAEGSTDEAAGKKWIHTHDDAGSSAELTWRYNGGAGCAAASRMPGTNESGCSDTHTEGEGAEEGCSFKRQRTGAVARDETKTNDKTGIYGSSRSGSSESSLAARLAEDVEVRMRVLNTRGQEVEVVARVRTDAVDLSAHPNLLAVPEALRGLDCDAGAHCGEHSAPQAA